MRKLIIILTIGAGILMLSCPTPSTNTKTTGVQVSCNLASPGDFIGVYVWVTDSSDQYVKTINYYFNGSLLYYYNSGTHNDTPAEWISYTGLTPGTSTTADVDGISHASQVQGSTFISDNWKLTNVSGNAVPVGTYRIHVNAAAEGADTSYYYADISINGTSSTATLILSNGFSSTMSGGSVTYMP